LFLEIDFPSIHSQQHCNVKSEFDYFADGGFTDRPTLVYFQQQAAVNSINSTKFKRLRMALLMFCKKVSESIGFIF